MSDIQVINYCKQLSDFDSSVRRFAVKKLLQMKNPASIPYLIRVLNDDDVLVRTNAETTLIEIGPKKVPIIVDALNNPDSEVRLRAANIYKHYKTHIKLEEIVPHLLDEDFDVRKLIISTLEDSLSPEASSALWKMMIENTDENVRELVLSLLIKNGVGIGNEIIEDLKNTNLDECCYRAGCRIFIKMNPDGNEYFLDKSDSPYFEERIANLLSYVTSNSSNIIDLAIKATDDENIEVRKQAVLIIGKYGDKSNLLLLRDLMNTTSKGVWKVSKEAISEINKRN